MRHRLRGRKLGRSNTHRKAMFRNMASSLIRSVRVDEDEPNKPDVPGRIVTTLAKAKELRPFVEKLITLAKKAAQHEEEAQQYATTAERDSSEWKSWRESEEWNQWNQTVAPAVALRRRAFALLRDDEAVDILFDELAERFQDRPGGYTRIVRLPELRLGDSGQQALIEFVGERDRVQAKRAAPVVADEEDEEEPQAETEPAEEESPSAQESSETAAESQQEESDTAAESSETEETEGEDAKDEDEDKQSS